MLRRINAKTKLKPAVVVVAVALTLTQNTLFLSTALLFDAPSYLQNIWLALNISEVVVLLVAATLIWRINRLVSGILVLIAVHLLVGLVLENFVVETLGDIFWVITTALLSFGLIVGAIFLAMGRSGSGDQYTISK